MCIFLIQNMVDNWHTLLISGSTLFTYVYGYTCVFDAKYIYVSKHDMN